MPLFEFRCTGCGERFDALLTAQAAAPACPACGGHAERIWSSFVAGPAARGASTWTPAATRTDRVGAAHRHHHH